MTIIVVAGICVVLLVLAFVVPRLSSKAQRGVDGPLAWGERAGGKAPGALGRLLRKPFANSRKATNKSASLGRRSRAKLPL